MFISTYLDFLWPQSGYLWTALCNFYLSYMYFWKYIWKFFTVCRC